MFLARRQEPLLLVRNPSFEKVNPSGCLRGALRAVNATVPPAFPCGSAAPGRAASPFRLAAHCVHRTRCKTVRTVSAGGLCALVAVWGGAQRLPMVGRAGCEMAHERDSESGRLTRECRQRVDAAFGPSIVEPYPWYDDDDDAAETGEPVTEQDAPAPAAPTDPSGPQVQPSLTVDDAEVVFEGCPDPNFPNVCQYSIVVTLDYVTPSIPSEINCSIGLSGRDERSVTDHSGTATLTVGYSILRGRPEWDKLEVSATCSMFATGGEAFGSVSVVASADRPEDID